jgi:hypothetical protein
MSGIARGPLQLLLQSSGGQWILMGLGAFAFFPDKVKELVYPAFERALALELPTSRSVGNHTAANTPIFIHTPSPTIIDHRGEKGLGNTIVVYAIGAGACWVSYIVITNALPDAIKEMLPVTRKFFEKTAKTLGQGILNVKEVLEEKMLGLDKKQDDLVRKQDETHERVLDMKDELGEARVDLSTLGESLGRCETTLESSQHMHSYSTRGVKLLVRCLVGILPTNDLFLDDLADFLKDGQKFSDAPKSSAPASTPTNRLYRREQEQLPPVTPDSSRYLQRRDSRESPSCSSSVSSRLNPLNDINALLGHM